jgi:hypothetical protein
MGTTRRRSKKTHAVERKALRRGSRSGGSSGLFLLRHRVQESINSRQITLAAMKTINVTKHMKSQ